MKSIYHKLIALSSICGIICLFMIPTILHAQTKCSNQRLTEIYEQLDQTKQTKHSPIVVNKNPQGIIDHIGIKLFDRELISTQVTPIYRFIERYFLELLLLPSQQEIMNKMKMERIRIHSDIHSMVSIKEGLQNIIDDFSSDQSVHIICHNNRYIVSFMKNKKNLLKMSFPVRYELIDGYTKIEAESSFYPNLLMHQAKNILPSEEDMFTYQDSLFYMNEDFYLTEDFISTSFYEKNEEKISPIFSEDMLMESVYNLFNAQYDRNIEAELTQNMYGEKNLSYHIPLAKLIDFLHQENCDLYTAIQKYDKTTIEGVVMAINSDLGYQHMFLFSFPKDLINHPQKHQIKMKMYAYIPIHNVSSLFESKKTTFK